MTEWITIMQATKIAGVCRRTVYNWLATGKLTCVYTPGGRRRIDRAALLQVTRPITNRERRA